MSTPRQVQVVSSPARRSGQGVEAVAFFDEDGNPVDVGGGGSVSWGSVTNKPSTFTPSDHEHDINDVTGLQAALDNLQTQIDSLSNGD